MNEDNLPDNQIAGFVETIKNDIITTRNKVFENANSELISLYFRIGKIISENSKYGTGFVNTLSASLKLEFEDAAGYSPRNLSRMKKFYEEYSESAILPPAVAKLPWTHNCILIEK